MIRLMREKESISDPMYQIGSPTYASDLAAVYPRLASGVEICPGDLSL